jgi:UDP-N-acetylglucosamine/UDP-N-acetylgalactosamine diphosphorylase
MSYRGDVMAVDFHALRATLERAGQGHLLTDFELLRAPEQAEYLRELATLDLARVRELQSVLRAPRASGHARIAPPHLFPLERRGSLEAQAFAARARGTDALTRGAVAALTVAGGQASRLGYEAPKGVYPIGPLSGYSLFEIFARKLRSAGARAGFRPLWYVMTSPVNDAATRQFFAERDNFGLRPEQVFFFQQSMLPALSPEGLVIRASPTTLFRAPTGHGGVLEALSRSGALDHAREHGVAQFAYFQIDNPLVPPFDPLFFGLHLEQGARMSSKVVKKRDASEKVGVLCYLDERLACIEYSDLPAPLRESVDEHGQLVYSAGNIAIHAIERTFVEELTGGSLVLPWHLARKRMPVYDPQLGLVEREGVKFETFVFDALGFSARSLVLEVERAREFSPVKNASGVDSPATTRADICRLHAHFAARAGWEIPPHGPEGYPLVEIDPLLGEEPEHFEAHGPRVPRRTDRGVFYE